MLDNIEVGYDDLVKKKYDIISRYDAKHEIFQLALTEGRREVFSAVKSEMKKNNPIESNTQLDARVEDVIDLPQEEHLKNKIALLAVAFVYEQNKMFPEAAYYRQLADREPLRYGYDENSNDNVDAGETVYSQSVTLGGR